MTIRLLAMLILFTTATVSLADDDKTKLFEEIVRPVTVPAGSFIVVARDNGDPGNRRFGKASPGDKAQKANGLDVETARWVKTATDVTIGLSPPVKRTDDEKVPQWSMRIEYATKTEKEIEIGKLPPGVTITPERPKVFTKFTTSMTMVFDMAVQVQKIRYQENGRNSIGFCYNIIESPVPIKLKDVATGIQGLKLYEIPYGEVNGKIRSVVVIVGDDLASASRTFAVSDYSSRFAWDKSYFGDRPPTKDQR